MVLSVSWSPDGTRIASGSDDGTIKIWDVARGQCLQTLDGHGGLVRSVSWSPDGTRIASGSIDRTIKIWNVETGQCLQTLDEHGDWVVSVSWDPNGTRIASGSYDGTIKIWNVGDSKQRNCETRSEELDNRIMKSVISSNVEDCGSCGCIGFGPCVHSRESLGVLVSNEEIRQIGETPYLFNVGQLSDFGLVLLLNSMLGRGIEKYSQFRKALLVRQDGKNTKVKRNKLVQLRNEIDDTGVRRIFDTMAHLLSRDPKPSQQISSSDVNSVFESKESAPENSFSA